MREIFFNPMTMIALNLAPSVGVIVDAANWNANSDELVMTAMESKQPLTIIYFEKDNGQNNRMTYEAIKVEAAATGAVNLVTVYMNPMMKSFENLVRQLNLTKVYILSTDVDKKEWIKVMGKKNVVVFDWKQTSCSAWTITDMMFKQGDVSGYKKEFGAYYSVKGYVSEGQKLGRTIGYPTANIPVDPKFKLHQGVYLVRVTLPNDKQKHWGMADLWINPISGLTLETFIFDFDKDIYGSRMDVEMIEFIRDNKPVKSLEEVKALLDEDKKTCLELIKKIK